MRLCPGCLAFGECWEKYETLCWSDCRTTAGTYPSMKEQGAKSLCLSTRNTECGLPTLQNVTWQNE